MKLTHIRSVGRFRNASTGQTAHIKRGKHARKGDIFFFGKSPRMLVTAEDLRNPRWWTRVDWHRPLCCGGNDDVIDHDHTLDCDKHPGEPIPVPVRTPPVKLAPNGHTVACTNSKPLEWESLAGMLIFRVVDGEKRYSWRCPTCGMTGDTPSVQSAP